MDLFIDDERDPFGKMGQVFGVNTQDLLWVKTSAQALKAVQTQRPFINIWFDHDLGGDDNTLIVAQAMAELVFHDVCTPQEIVQELCLIHTSNPVGRKNLHLILNRWGFTTQDVWM